MKIGLIDVDGHHFPNLALMRISAYHKSIGDEVEWWWGDLFHYDRVYMSKIFSDAYSPDVPEPVNADEVIKGGTGYCISLGEDGKEHFDNAGGLRIMGVKIPKNQVLWATYYDAPTRLGEKGKPKWAIVSDPARIKWYLYKIEGDKAVKVKTGVSPAEFEDEVGKI